MEGLLIAAFVLASTACIGLLFIAGAVAYVLYKYVALPWKVMRADMIALAQKVQAVEASVQRAQVIARSDEEIARIEARQNARERARRGMSQ